MLSIIVAIDQNNAIGKDGQLLCHLPNDLKRFRKLTKGNTVIMGRKTWDRLPLRYKPLPNRKNIIISKHGLDYHINDDGTINTSIPYSNGIDYIKDDVWVYNNLNEAIYENCFADEETFIIGGQSIYEQTIDYVDKIYMTIIHHKFDGADIFFQPKNELWELIEDEYHPADDKHPYSYEFKTFIKNDKPIL